MGGAMGKGVRRRGSMGRHPTKTWTRSLAALAVVCGVVPGSTAPVAAQAPPPCGDDPAFHRLDFWLGEWTVWVDGRQVGTNLIRAVQGACAIEEHWEDAAGGTGQSLFYLLPASGEWKQVWVTPMARAAGGVKEKTLVEGAPDDGVRFRGTIRRADGTSYLDRTTLTPIRGGRVRQHLEVSTDDGQTWRTTFDAEYRPRSSPGGTGGV
jgi:hypothetical protein